MWDLMKSRLFFQLEGGEGGFREVGMDEVDEVAGGCDFGREVEASVMKEVGFNAISFYEECRLGQDGQEMLAKG